jgi:DNA uptake protein ComE-like DNA-binding protein
MINFLKEFFYLQQSDRKVILTLLAVAAVALGVVFLTGSDETVSVITSGDSLQSDRSSLHSHSTNRRHHQDVGNYATPQREVRLFAFDPNTADSTQLLTLGLQPWQVRNIYKYRAAGGIYRRPEDFARLYGLTAGEYRRLKPYIRISADYQPAAKLREVQAAEAEDKERPFGLDSTVYPKKITAEERIVLNTADSSTLRSVPGIGIHFARQIISHGKQLGGYVSVDQLDEIDYFPKEAKKYFVINHPQPQKLNVNRLTFSQLRRHPYIGYHQAKAIVDYRRLHGRISSLSQLKLSPAFTPEVISRLEPYVEY